MPRLSVLLPVRNAERYVGDAVRSALRALPRDAELVVLDDASTDGTAEILESVADKKLRVIQTQRNLGVAAGLNRLLSATDSEFVARMDADDIVLPTRFTHQMQRLDVVSVTFCSVFYISGRGRLLRPQLFSRMAGQGLGLQMLIANVLVHPAMAARRSALDSGYRSSAAEDYELWLRLIAEGYSLERTSKIGLLYRRHSAQISRDKEWQARVMKELEEEGPLWLAYVAAHEKLLGRAPTRNEFRSAMRVGVQAPERPEIRAAAKQLSLGERAMLNLRLGRVAAPETHGN